jgi:polysaccharide biosynthesis transport protein
MRENTRSSHYAERVSSAEERQKLDVSSNGVVRLPSEHTVGAPFDAQTWRNRHPVGQVANSVDTSTGLRHYIEILRKHKRLVLVTMLVVPIAAYVYTLLQSPAYEATSKVLLSRQNIAANLTGVQDPSGFELSDRPVQTQAALARVPEVVRRTLVAGKRTDLSVQEFLLLSSVAPAGGSDLLEFKVTMVEPWAAEQLASAYARQFTQYRRELDTAPARRARAQLQARIRQLRKDGQTGGALYESLLDKEQQLATFEALQTSNAFVVQESLGAVQVQPTTKRNLILGFGFGVLLAIGLAALAHALDTRGKTVRSLEEKLGVPLLGRIPAPPSGNGSLVMRYDPSGVHAEAFRVLRANLEFVNRGTGARVIMVTSAIEGEGKSTTISNLALAYAREGKRAIVVDLDLRRPTLARLFDVADRPGVVEAAYGRVSVDSALQRVGGDGRGAPLHVLAGTPPAGDIGEFPASDQLKALLAELRSRADFVFVDAPPLLVSSDAITLGSVVDGIVLVTGHDSLRWEALDDVIRSLSMCAAPTLGWVVTGAEALAGYHAYTSTPSRA